MAGATETFFRNWGVHHRVSSVAHLHSNCRAELGVKTVKRKLVGSTGPVGFLHTGAFQQAMLAYINTPDPVSRVSPAETIFGRRIRDFIPAPPGQYLPHCTWRETLEAREDALRVRHMRAHERLSEHKRSTSTDHRKLRKAAEAGWSPSNQMGPNRNRCRSATV